MNNVGRCNIKSYWRSIKRRRICVSEKGLCLIGRSGDCALLIPKEKDMRISRRHCLLILDPPKARIRDLGSRNGTFVNQEQLKPGSLGDVPEQRTPQDLALNHGDKLTIGETEFEVLIPSQENIAVVVAPPPGTKVIKLAKPDKTQPGSLIPKSAPVDTGFFISPGMAKGKSVSTATAPLTEVFMKPKIGDVPLTAHNAPAKEKPKRVIAKKVAPQATLKPASPAPDATLILKAKPPVAAEEPPPVAAEEPPPVAAEEPPPVEPVAPAPQPQVEKPKKVLKGKIIKKTSAPAKLTNARKEFNPELTEVMDISDLSDDIKLSADYIKKQKSNKRVTKFKVKGPK